MARKKRVLIHCIRESMTNLSDTIRHFRPDYVYLLASGHHAAEGKAGVAYNEIDQNEERTFGRYVKDIEHVALHQIEKAWHKETMADVIHELGEIKADAEKRAQQSGAECEIYAGLSDATGLFPHSVAFAAMLHDMKTYYTRGRRPYYNDEFVLEIDTLNGITSAKSWLEAHSDRKKNLKYLEALIGLERDGEVDVKRLSLKVGKDVKTTRNACNKLAENGMLEYSEGGRNRSISSTTIGKMCIKFDWGRS
jgi:predicted transcriptional regulator